MSLLFENNAISTLAAGISDSDLSLTIQAADGLLFPSPSGNDSFLCTLSDASNNIEIVEVTNKSSDTFTIVRGQEGTVAKAYLSGDSVELRVTAGVLSQYRQGVGDGVTDYGTNSAIGLAQVHDFINCTAAITITLADAATMAEGYQVTIKNSSAGKVTITPSGGDTIDGVAGSIGIGPAGSVYLSVNEAEDGYISMFNGAVASHPIGALYFSTVATNPATILGFGTWVAIPGRFIVGVGDNGDGKAYTSGEEGGSKDAVVVAHQHASAGAHSHTVPFRVDPVGDSEGGNGDKRIQEVTSSTSSAGAHQHPSEGVSGVGANNPAFFGAYIWRRTA